MNIPLKSAGESQPPRNLKEAEEEDDMQEDKLTSSVLARESPATTSSSKDRKRPAVKKTPANSASRDNPVAATPKRRPRKKQEGRPKRPLSAYNFFFREERQFLLGEEVAKDHVITDQSKRTHRKSHGKIGFSDMAKLIGKRWKEVDTKRKQMFEAQARKERKRYAQELEIWNKKRGEDPTETTESMEEDDAIIRDVSLRDSGHTRPFSNEERPSWDTSETRLALLQRGPEGFSNYPRFAAAATATATGSSYNPMMHASLPSNYGGSSAVHMQQGGRASLPGYLTMGQPGLSGDSFTSFQGTRQPDRRASNFEPGPWQQGWSTASFGLNLSQASTHPLENERLRQMEERYRINLAEGAYLREQLRPHSNPGMGTEPMLQPFASSDTNMRARLGPNPNTAPIDILAMDRNLESRRLDVEIMAMERARAARRAELVVVERALEIERAMHHEEELRKRRSM